MALSIEWPGLKRKHIASEFAEGVSKPMEGLDLLQAELRRIKQGLSDEKFFGMKDLPSTIPALAKAVEGLNSVTQKLSESAELANQYPIIGTRNQTLRRLAKRLFSKQPTIDDQFVQQLQLVAELEDACKVQVRDMLEEIQAWEDQTLPVDTSHLDEDKFGKALEDGRAEFARKIFVESGWKPFRPLVSAILRVQGSGIDLVFDRITTFAQYERDISTTGLDDTAALSPEFPDRFEEISAEHAVVGLEDLDTSYDPSSNRAHHPGEFDFGIEEFPTPPRHANVPPISPVQHEQGRVRIDVSR